MSVLVDVCKHIYLYIDFLNRIKYSFFFSKLKIGSRNKWNLKEKI